MAEERWTRINELFHGATEIASEERAHYLASACGSDKDLCREVENLIAAHEAAEASMKTDFLRGAIREVAEDESLTIGQQFGPYRVVSEIGRGGMGRVFLAERVDQEFRRRVAIKLIKRGMDTDAIIRHFKNEREILASLDHPNIARLLDGGTSQDGQPYFVMEYIEGRPISCFCDEHNYSIPERLQLFRKVCAAVAYAHQHLVIHRDIKPSNILVTADGEAKLLDFGIARLLRTDEISQTSATVTGLPLMTPEYASPEQILGLATSTLTDVYSLGVVLYNLLTGTTPYAFCSPEHRAEKACQEEPKKPSSAVAEVDAIVMAPCLQPELNLRNVRRDPKSLEGDLDNIVLKAIRREPERRYQSVEQLSDDVRRHLELLPVLARKDSATYRLSKFTRRHRTAVTAGALALVALIAGIVTISLEARRARIQEQLAKEAQARAERRFSEVRNLARTVLFDYHDAIKNLPGSTPVRERLVRDALQYLDGLAAEAASDRSLLRELASAYERVADVQGGTLESNLGNTAEAIKSGRKALSIRQQLLASDRHDVEVQKELGSSYIKVGTLLWETGDLVGAADDFRQSIQLREEIAKLEPHDFGVLRDLAAAYDRLGMLLLERGDASAALAYHRKSLSSYLSLPREESLNEPTRRALSVAYEHIGSDLLELNDLPAALQNNTLALQLRADLAREFPLNSEHQRTLQVSYYNQGEILARMGNIKEAMTNYRQDVLIAEKLFRNDPSNAQYRGDLAYGLIRVGDMQFKLRNLPEALTKYKRSRDLRAVDAKSDPSNLWKTSSFIEAKAKMCKTLAAMYERAQAREACSDALSLMQSTNIAPDNAAIRSFFADTFSDLAEADATLAGSPALSSPERRKSWHSARELYAQSRDIWQDLKDRNILGPADKDKDAIASRNIKRCEAALH
jgi:eukaryotic-like serine/threonine-protein kinase